MIDFLNKTVKATIAPSKIHGVGVFALRDIKKGEQCYLLGGDRQWIKMDSLKGLRPEIRELIDQRWPLAQRGKSFQGPNSDVRHICFINHSDDPNYDQATDCAIKDIKEGEEITESYLVMESAEEICPFLREL